MKFKSPLYFYRILGWKDKMTGINSLGYTILGYLMTGKFNFLPLFLNALAILFGIMFAFSINNYFDWKTQKEKNFLGKIIEEKKISQRKALFFCFLPLIFGFLIISFSLTKKLIPLLPFFLYLIISFLTLFYALPPIRLKEKKFIGFLAVPLGSFLIFLQGYFIFGKLSLGFVLFSLLLFLFMVYLEIFHNLEDSLVKEEVKKISQDKALKLLKMLPWASLYTSFAFFLLKPIFLVSSLFSLVRLVSLEKFKIKNIRRIRRNNFSLQLSFYEFFIYGILGLLRLI